DSFQPGTEGMHLTGKATVKVGRAANKFNPWMAFNAARNYLRSSIRRTVIDYNPALRQRCLSNHRVKRFFNESLLVVRRCDQDVLHTRGQKTEGRGLRGRAEVRELSLISDIRVIRGFLFFLIAYNGLLLSRVNLGEDFIHDLGR